MSDRGDIATGEQAAHAEVKKGITSRIDSALSDLTKQEAALLAGIGGGSAAVIKVIMVLLAIPDVTWSKIVAALLAIGLAISLIWSIWKIISNSLSERPAIRKQYADEEIAEDARYTRAMERILAMP